MNNLDGYPIFWYTEAYLHVVANNESRYNSHDLNMQHYYFTIVGLERGTVLLPQGPVFPYVFYFTNTNRCLTSINKMKITIRK